MYNIYNVGDYMKKGSYDDEVMKYVNFFIPKKYIDMIDELACEKTDGNRTQMFIKLVKKEYENGKDEISAD